MKLSKVERLAIIDVIEAALVAQGSGAIDISHNRCRYRIFADDVDEMELPLPATVAYLACGIGHLIPDDRYALEMENCGISLALSATGIPNDSDDENWFLEVQKCHDEAASAAVAEPENGVKYDFITLLKHNFDRMRKCADDWQ